MSNDVTLDVDDGVAFITLNRPERLNALTVGWVDDFIRAIDEVGDEAAVVVRAAGRAFCAGADLAEHPVFRLDDAYERMAHVERAYQVVRKLRALPQPVIAAVQGVCAGAGLSVAVACDLRLAADDARFSLDFVRLGVIPDMGASYHVPAVVGTTRAMELALLAERIDAVEAERIGLVNRVVPAADLWAEAEAMARRVAAMPPMAVRAAKRVVHSLHRLPADEALSEEAWTVNALVAMPESRAAVAAFVNRKRTNP
ncbi:MAG TPA: enoyl-CoA hydratase/isomerase family protein [Acidimicrobiales bacterium]|nr:enoyl-CoA hydratase/isomerase family protein [Acidimicrobiales bacterium]